MEVCVLASGSSGNSIYVAGGGVALLVDAGLSARELTARLNQAGLDPTGLRAVLCTHDHSDHFKGLEVFSRRYPVRLFANEGTAAGIEQSFPGRAFDWEIFETASCFYIGGLRVEPFTVSHDASDPVGFLFDDGISRLCVVTDLGQESAVVCDKLERCQCVILESNHDPDMLMASDRAWSLKSRIAGRSGHLSNSAAAEMMSRAAGHELHTLLLAHLSEQCNTRALALNTMRTAMSQAGRTDVRIEVLSQNEVSSRFIF
ncbi:MAG: MBL fold metallo-hydrolase [Kiritimatiellae bacterium]|nr:MBL fold metallo-hydrolase [Kiritimatiellia bacterium]